MKQLGFEFLNENDYNINNFIVFESNEEAYYFLNKDKYDENILTNQLIFLYGEKKCGKTHLSMIWKQKHNAKRIDYNELFSLSIDDFIKRINDTIEKFDYYLIDGVGKDINEEKFFYLLNYIINNNSAILIISEYNFFKKKFHLKDLKSRINSGVNLRIKKLQKNIKTMFIVKLFSDKQIAPNGEILKYLTKKLETKYETIFNFVNDINVELNNKKQRLTLKLVKEFLQYF